MSPRLTRSNGSQCHLGPKDTPAVPTGTARPVRHHLVIVHRRCAKPILSGRKNIECRFTTRRILPFGQVHRGDVLWFKQPSAPGFAIARVKRASYCDDVSPDFVRNLRANYKDAIGAGRSFFKRLSEAKVVSLIHFGQIRRVEFQCNWKRDRRAWAIFDPPRSSVNGTKPFVQLLLK
jgi:hypothetical protein